MAKRHQASTGSVILLFLLFGLFFALTYIAPFLLIGLWAYYEHQARRGVSPNIEAASERSDERSLLREEIELSKNRIAELHQEGCDQGLKRRQGSTLGYRMFDTRYTDGRELNELIEGEGDALIYMQQQLVDIVKPLARRDAMRFALISYFGLLLVFWSRSVEMLGTAMSLWSSFAAIVVGLITYAVRKTHYAAN